MLTKEAKQNLLGPTSIGVIFGVLGALAALAFDSAYGRRIYAASKFTLGTISIAHAIVVFFLVAGGVILMFGIVPVVVSRLAPRAHGARDTHD